MSPIKDMPVVLELRSFTGLNNFLECHKSTKMVDRLFYISVEQGIIPSVNNNTSYARDHVENFLKILK